MENFYGFEMKNFKFDGMNAVVVFADKANRTDKWLFKTEYFGAFPELELMMLKEGYNLAHVDNKTRLCYPSDTERQAAFCKYLHEAFGFREQCATVGMSCGGMQAIYLAAKHPELVSVLYIDAPVVNLLSWPAGFGKSVSKDFCELETMRGMTLSDLLVFREHPLDFIPKLDKNLPIILVSGDSDTLVPYDENGIHLYDYAKAHGMNIELHIKPGGDHHPHGLPENNQVIADFIKRYY